MPKTVTIKAPVKNKDSQGFADVSGHVVRLYVEDIKHKFLIQHGAPTAPNETFLTDYASGMTLGSLAPMRVRATRTGAQTSDRTAAQNLLNKLVSKHGRNAILSKLDAAETINGGKQKA